MERKLKDYNNGKIYCIRNRIDDQIYIGSTCQNLSKRMAYHRSDAKKTNRQNTLIYPLMMKYGIENFYIELVEECPCENSSQLERREGELMREMKASLNKVVAGRTVEEYKVEEAEKIKKAKAISDKKYAEKNEEKIRAYRKEYYWKDAEKFKERARNYTEEHKEAVNAKKREYYYKNRDKILQNRKTYREENKDKIAQKNREYHLRKKEQKQKMIDEVKNEC